MLNIKLSEIINLELPMDSLGCTKVSDVYNISEERSTEIRIAMNKAIKRFIITEEASRIEHLVKYLEKAGFVAQSLPELVLIGMRLLETRDTLQTDNAIGMAIMMARKVSKTLTNEFIEEAINENTLELGDSLSIFMSAITTGTDVKEVAKEVKDIIIEYKDNPKTDYRS